MHDDVSSVGSGCFIFSSSNSIRSRDSGGGGTIVTATADAKVEVNGAESRVNGDLRNRRGGRRQEGIRTIVYDPLAETAMTCSSRKHSSLSSSSSKVGRTNKWKLVQQFSSVSSDNVDGTDQSVEDVTLQRHGHRVLTSISSSLLQDQIISTTRNNHEIGGSSISCGINTTGRRRRGVRTSDTPLAMALLGDSSSSLHPLYSEYDSYERWAAISFAVFEKVVAVIVGYWFFVVLILPNLKNASD